MKTTTAATAFPMGYPSANGALEALKIAKRLNIPHWSYNPSEARKLALASKNRAKALLKASLMASL